MLILRCPCLQLRMAPVPILKRKCSFSLAAFSLCYYCYYYGVTIELKIFRGSVIEPCFGVAFPFNASTDVDCSHKGNLPGMSKNVGWGGMGGVQHIISIVILGVVEGEGEKDM